MRGQLGSGLLDKFAPHGGIRHLICVDMPRREYGFDHLLDAMRHGGQITLLNIQRDNILQIPPGELVSGPTARKPARPDPQCDDSHPCSQHRRAFARCSRSSGPPQRRHGRGAQAVPPPRAPPPRLAPPAPVHRGRSPRGVRARQGRQGLVGGSGRLLQARDQDGAGGVSSSRVRPHVRHMLAEGGRLGGERGSGSEGRNGLACSCTIAWSNALACSIYTMARATPAVDEPFEAADAGVMNPASGETDHSTSPRSSGSITALQQSTLTTEGDTAAATDACMRRRARTRPSWALWALLGLGGLGSTQPDSDGRNALSAARSAPWLGAGVAAAQGASVSPR